MSIKVNGKEFTSMLIPFKMPAKEKKTHILITKRGENKQ